MVDLFAGGAVATDAAGPLSNTPLTNRQESAPSPLARRAVAGLDWLEWCCYGSWDSHMFERLREGLDAAQRSAQVASEETVIDLGGEAVAVRSSGVRRGLYCKWAFTWEGIEFAVMDRKDQSEHVFNVHVIAHSLPCMEAGQGVYSRVCRFLESLGFTQSRTVVSRVDLACDLVGVSPAVFAAAFTAGAVVRRARHSALFFDGLRSTGLTIGKSTVMLRVYDKLLESRQSGDEAKFAVLVEKRWGGESQPEGGATRVEFQLKREALRAMSFDDVPNLLGNLHEVCRWLTEDWVRFTDGVSSRTHTERCESSALWSQVQAALQAAFRHGHEVPIIWRRRLRVIPGKLVRQAAGCLSSAFALLGTLPETVEELGEAVVSVLADLAGNMLADAVAKRGLFETRGGLEVLVGAACGVQGPYSEFLDFSGNSGPPTEHKKHYRTLRGGRRERNMRL